MENINPILKFRVILDEGAPAEQITYSLTNGLHNLDTQTSNPGALNFEHTMITKSREAVDSSESSFH